MGGDQACRSVSPRAERDEQAELPGYSGGTNAGVLGIEPQDMPGHEHSGGRPRRSDDCDCIFQRRGQWLLDQDMLAGLERRDSRPPMLMLRRRDADRCDGVISDQRVMAAIPVRNPISLGDRRRSVGRTRCHGRDFHVRQALIGANVALAKCPESDNTHPQSILHPLPQRSIALPPIRHATSIAREEAAAGSCPSPSRRAGARAARKRPDGPGRDHRY